jgi:inosine-uridine nucleoside N-ribohydrolase
MTSLARVVDSSPELVPSIERIVAMGGAFDVPGNIRVPGFTESIPNPTAEWNLFADPVAAQVVLASGVPVMFVPLDATNSAPLRPAFRAEVDRLAAEGSPAARLVHAVLDRVVRPEAGEYYHWDPLAALVATGDVTCRETTRTIRVLAEPGGVVPQHDVDLEAFPWTDWHGEPRVNLDARTAGTIVDDPAGAPVRVCLSAALDEFAA